MSGLGSNNLKKALITGITGQDGSYLAELLLDKGYEVHGIMRRVSSNSTNHLNGLLKNPETSKKFFLHYGDLSDANSLRKVIFEIYPDEVYNLAAQSHVRISFDQPEYTIDVTGLGALRILEVIRDFQAKTAKQVKLYQASSSEMFGSAPPPQNETTPFHPRSPYGCAKTLAHYVTQNYREAYGIFTVNGILFNHESPRRGDNFVTRKITKSVARIKAGLDKKLYLGNLDSKRDWGYAKEYMEATWLMMQKDTPEDYVIGTGESHSVKEFLEEAFSYASIGDWRNYVEIDPNHFRPTEVENLVADITKAKNKLGWQPKTSFKNLVHLMVDADITTLASKE